MQIQSTSLMGSGVSTTVQDSTPVSSKEGAQGLKSSGQADSSAPAKVSPGKMEKPSSESLSDELKQALEKLNDTVKKTQPQLEFSVDDDTQLHVVKLIDKNNGDIIRQFPSKEAIALAKSIDDYTGMLLKAKS